MRKNTYPFIVVKLNFMIDPLVPRLKKLIVLVTVFGNTGVWSNVCKEVFSSVESIQKSIQITSITKDFSNSQATLQSIGHIER